MADVRSGRAAAYLVLAVVAITGCMAADRAARVGVAAVGGTAEVLLTPRLEAGALVGRRGVQAVITAYSSASIATLSVLPFIETSPGQYQAIDAATGQATADTAPGIVRISHASPSINPDRKYKFPNLKPNSKYRFVARAYGTDGAQISDDSSSSVDLTVATDDRPALATLPIRLRDRVFSATASVTLDVESGLVYHHIDTRFVEVVNGAEVAVAGATASIASPADGYAFTFTNLAPNTTYRLLASLVDAQSAELATRSVDVVVTDDDAPAPRTLTFQQP